jgi:hypothetical protein
VTHLCGIVDVSVSLEQQGSDVLVAVVCRDVERRESRFRRHVRIVIAGLEKEPGGLGVVLLGGDVQGRKSDLAASVVLQKDSDDLVENLLLKE